MPSILVAFLALVGIILAGSALWAIVAPARDQVPGLGGAAVNVMALTASCMCPSSCWLSPWGFRSKRHIHLAW